VFTTTETYRKANQTIHCSLLGDLVFLTLFFFDMVRYTDFLYHC